MMTEVELYRYDVDGFLLLEDVLTSEQLEAINAMYDRRQEALEAQREKSEAGDHVMEDDILNMEPETLRFLVAHPRLLPYIDEMIDQPRLKSTWSSFMWPGGGVGFHSNHTPTCTCNYYHFNRRIRHNLFQVFVALRDIPADGGALQILPGSHKANYPLPDHDTIADRLTSFPMKAGSILIFPHDIYHGSLNSGDELRRVLIYTYSPGVIANSFGGDGLYDDLFEAAPEGSWQKYLLRRPNGYMEMHPRPGGRAYEDG
jgi:ectoine hydroxylase-related dioxygenase (phytanoyl-CoA dioxygenase family)